MNRDRVQKTKSIKIACQKKLARICIFTPAERHSTWDACVVITVKQIEKWKFIRYLSNPA